MLGWPLIGGKAVISGRRAAALSEDEPPRASEVPGNSLTRIRPAGTLHAFT